MRYINIFFAAIAGACLLSLVACNKGEADFLYKNDILPINVSGYNGSNEKLEIKIDTFRSKQEPAGGLFNWSEAYTFPNGQSSVKLTITEKGTGKMVLDSLLKKEDGLASISFFYFNGKVSDMPVAQPVEEGKIKLSYMFIPNLTNYSEPVDIVLGKFYFTPKVFEEITRIENVKPNEFSEAITLSTFPTAGQVYNGQPTVVQFQVYVFKAGTDVPYTAGTSYTWNASNSSAPKPSPTTATSKIYVFGESPSGTLMRFDKKIEL